MGALNSIKRFFSAREAFLLLLPVLAVLLYFLVDLIQGDVIVSADTTKLHYILRRWHMDSIVAQGVIPLWNDGLLSGIPIMADPQLGLFSPLLLIYCLVDGYRAHQLYMMLILSAGGFGMTLYLRCLTGQNAISSYVATCYIFSGVVLSYLYNTVFLAGICIFPWVLWRYHRLKARPGFHNSVFLSLTIAWVILEGDPVGCFWMSGYLFVDSVFHSLRKKARTTVYVIGSALGAFGLAAVALLPPFDTIQETTRAVGLSFEETSYFSMPVAQLLHLLVPSFWGSGRDITFWGHALIHEDLPFDPRFWFESIYLSVPLLFFFCTGVFGAFKERKNVLLAGFVLLFTLVALGDNFFLHRLLHDLIPFYGKLRFPAKFFAYANVFLFGLIAIGVARFFQASSSDEGKREFGYSLVGIIALFFLSALVNSLFSPAESEWAAMAGGHRFDVQTAKGLISKNLISSICFGACLALILVLSRLRDRKGDSRTRIVAVLVLLVGFIDLLVWAPPRVAERVDVVDRKSAVSDALPSVESGQYKIARDSLLDQFRGEVRSRMSRESLAFNWGLLEGIRHTFGYEPIGPARLYAFSGATFLAEFETWGRVLGVTHITTPVHPPAPLIRALEERGRIKFVKAIQRLNLMILQNLYDVERYELFDARRLVKGEREALAEIRKRGAEKGGAILEEGEVLFEGKRTRAREFIDALLRLPAGPGGGALSTSRVEFEKENENRRVFDLDVQGPLLLVVKENFHPGWRARLDGVEVPIYRADFMNMGVMVDRGNTLLELEFEPDGYRLGKIISLLTLLAVAASVFVLALLGWRRRRA